MTLGAINAQMSRSFGRVSDLHTLHPLPLDDVVRELLSAGILTWSLGVCVCVCVYCVPCNACCVCMQTATCCPLVFRVSAFCTGATMSGGQGGNKGNRSPVGNDAPSNVKVTNLC